MKNYLLTPNGQAPAVSTYRLQPEKDGRWTLNVDGFAIFVFPSKAEAMANCIAIVNANRNSLRIEMPDGSIERPHRGEILEIDYAAAPFQRRAIRPVASRSAVELPG